MPSSSQQEQQQHQVAEAARAMVRPSTDGATRTAASQFLEQWNLRPEAWDVYVAWISSFNNENNSSSGSGTVDAETMGMQLLCLQLLQSKIRREVRFGSQLQQQQQQQSQQRYPEVLGRIQSELASFLTKSTTASKSSPAISPTCICVAALAVRCGNVSGLIETATASVNKAEGGGGGNDANSGNNNDATTTTTTALDASTALRLLANIPQEMEACGELTTPQVTAELWPYLERILDVIRRALQRHLLAASEAAASDAAVHATEALKHWTKYCHITLSHYNTPTCGGSERLLPVLVQVMSQPPARQHQHQQHQHQRQYLEKIWIEASQALTEAFLVPTDSCTEPRSAASRYVFDAVGRQGFVAYPLQVSTSAGWNDACHSLATCICTAVGEEADDVVQQPSESLLNLLVFQIQNHAEVKVRMTVLECWLTVQEIPTADRHDNWKAPLFSQVVEGIVATVAYPSYQFRDWSTVYEIETPADVVIEQSDFDEYRQMVQDVLMSAYFLLRSDVLCRLVELIVTGRGPRAGATAAGTPPDWTVQESALFAMTSISRGVCARVKSRSTGSTSLAQDRERTSEQLLNLVQYLLYAGAAGGGNARPPDPARAVDFASSQHWLVLSGIAKLIGAYAPAWATKCPPEGIMHLLSYLRAAMVQNASAPTGGGRDTRRSPAVAVDAAKAIRSVLVACAAPLLADPALTSTPAGTRGPVLECLGEVLDGALSTDHEEGMAAVAEGCTRLIVQINDEAVVRQSLATLGGLFLQRAEAALAAVPADAASGTLPDHAVVAVESLGRYLHVLQVIIRFCDNGGGAGAASPGGASSSPFSDLINSIWPFLERVSDRVFQFEYILDKVLAVHEQMLKIVPELVAPHLQRIMKFVADVFQATKHASTLAYMTCAVEIFGPASVDSFRDLLTHVSTIVFSYVSTEKRIEDCPELISSFFELNQRYMLYCTAALVQCQQFQSIVSCAVECLTACRGERESTRATLNFLGHLFGWRSLRLSRESSSALSGNSQLLDEQVAKHGARVTRSCMATLLGGPQMLWPACTDCIFAVVSSSADWSAGPEDPNSNVAGSWMVSAMPENGKPEVYHQVVSMLIGMVRNGPKSKPKAKMLLTDYCKIYKGEMSVDALVSYTLS